MTQRRPLSIFPVSASEQLRRLFRRSSPEVVFLSAAKSGRTWHRVMLGSYLASVADKPVERALHLDELCRATGARRAAYTHNGANTHDLPFTSAKLGDPVDWMGKEVMVIVRDPRDILVSGYHHARFRKQTFDGSISAYIRDPTCGIEKILTAWNRWHDGRERAASFQVTSYERMHADPHQVLSDTIRLLGLEPLQNHLHKAVEFSTFENMKRYEETNLFSDRIMRNRRKTPEAAKVRQGKVGDYHQILNAKDLTFIETKIDELGNPFAIFHRSDPAEASAGAPVKHVVGAV